MKHRIHDLLRYGRMDSAQEIGLRNVEGTPIGWGKTVGNGIEGWAPNALFLHTDGGANDRIYKNVGNKTTAVWAEDDLYPDDASLIFGTGSDITFNWDGTNFIGGPTAKMWGNAPSPASADYDSVCHHYFNDFRHLSADYDVTNEWTMTEDDASCTQAIDADAVGGTLLLTSQATTDDAATQIQMQQEAWRLAEGKKLWFEARIKCAAGATQIDWAAGLTVTEDLTGVADNMAANGVLIYKDDGDTDIDAASSDNGTNLTSLAIGTGSTGWVRVGFYFDGGATGAAIITPYIDGVAKTAIGSITYATTTEMAPIFMVRNGDGTTTQTMQIDYLKVVQLR